MAVTPAAATTDANGLAQAMLTLGSALGAYTVAASATAPGGAALTGSPASFTATAVQATQLAKVSGDSQTGSTLQPFSLPAVARTTDSAGKGVSGVDLSWAVTQAPAGATGFAVLPATCATDADGECRVTLFAGSQPGSYTAVATATGLAPAGGVQFTATAQLGSGNSGPYDGSWTGTTAQAGTTPRPVGFTIRSSTITAYSIEFALPQCGISVALANNAAAVSLTDNHFTLTEQFGVKKTITLVLAGTFSSATQGSGTFSVSDTSCSGSASGTWTATAPQATSHIRIASGNGQMGTVTQAVAAPLVVQVTDTSGNPQANQSVTFALTSQPVGAAGGALSAASALTDANGQASVNLTLGTVQGIYVVTAVAGSEQVTLLATAKPDVPAKTIKRSGDNQTVQPGSVLPVPICVTVTDAYNNAIPDLAVSFSIRSQPSGGNATLSLTAASTATHGTACTQMSGGHQLGSYLEETGFPGTDLLPVTFQVLVSQPAVLEKVSGDSQQAAPGTPLTNPLVVRVKDASGNPVMGVLVAFSLSSQSAGAAGASVTPSSCTTDVNGQCQAALTLGSAAGVYTVTATAADASGNPLAGSPVQFQATALAANAYVVGDTFPFGADPHANLLREEVGEFGDNQLTILDLIYALRAVTSVPGYRPRACSDRFDAMDSFPKDTEAARGGDGILNTVDLIYTLRRVTSVDASRPVRTSRGLACPAQGGQQAVAQAFQPVEVAQAALPVQPTGRLQLGSPEPVEGGAVRVPVYLQATQQLQLAGLSFSVRFSAERGTWNPEPGTSPAPTLVDTGVPGMLAIAWLDGITIPRGSRLLLGWVEANGAEALKAAPALAPRIHSTDAVGIDSRPVTISFGDGLLQ